MGFENFCRHCGNRLKPNEAYCDNCGKKTVFESSDEEYFFSPPIHTVGFFNFDIDFSPYIESCRNDFKYMICSCGYLNEKSNVYCGMCGSKLQKSKVSKYFRMFNKSKGFLENKNIDSPLEVICSCGYPNSLENNYCENCGKALVEREEHLMETDYANFDIEFENPVFCQCGCENQEDYTFCIECGKPLNKFSNNLNTIQIICVCSQLNTVDSKFCSSCGRSLSEEHSVNICVCGKKNDIKNRFCEDCQRPLNSDRLIKSKILCVCGEVLDYDTEFCHNCGINVSKIKNNDSYIDKFKNLIRRD